MTGPPRAELRVFMTADAVGGVWTYALDLARGLQVLRIATTLAVLGPSPSAADAQVARRIPQLELIDTGLPLDWLAGDEAELAELAATLAGLARHADADIVHLNGPALAASGRFRQPVVGVCHSCLASWWDAVRGGEPDRDLLWRIRMLARGYAACDALVAPSRSFACETRRLYGLLPTVVHNGRTSIGGPRGERENLVLTAGRLWDDGKNVATLDEAAALIAAPVFAAGPLTGPIGGARSLRHARPLGRLDAATLRGWMERAAVFASVAVYEPFGLAVLEAAQAGCALVLSDIPTFRELWDGAAMFVPPDQPAMLAATLQGLLDAPALAASLGEAAQRHARRYDVPPMAAAMQALYRGVLRNSFAQQAVPA